MNEKTEQQTMRQQILAQIDKCAELAYAAGSHFAQHGKHHPWSMRAKAEADAALVNLIEEYAASPSSKSTKEAERLTALLERLRERCAETAEGISSDYPESARDTAEAIRAIELDVAVRQYLASSSIKEDGERAEPPSVLFDGAAVYHALSPRARLRTSPENVADVLDAVVHVLKRESSSPPSPLGGTPDQQEQKHG